MKVGRHPKRSPERETAILNALRVGNTRRASHQAAGVSHQTFYNWLEDGTFLEAVEHAEAEAELRFLGQVAKHAATSPQAAQWWLERRRPVDYRRTDGVELTGEIEMRSVTEVLSDHERDILGEIIREAIAEKEPA